MRSSPRPLLTAVLVLSIPALLAGKGKCRKDPTPTDDGSAVVVEEQVPDPEIRLQVVSVAPGTLKPAARVPLTVYGAGFQAGAEIAIGSFRVTDVNLDDPNTLSLISPGLPQGTHDLVVTNPDGRSATLRSALRVVQDVDESCRRMAMYFELDSAGLSSSARTALTSAMPCLLKQNQIRLEGHADERGTTDYNLALGQRRARSVSEYLVSQGFRPGALPLVSYGEERPADPGHSEEAWAKNRRVEMVAQ